MQAAPGASAGDVLRDAAGTLHARACGPVRIVSLVPSLTELLFDLGLGESIVGRTGFCVHPRDRVRRVRKVGGTKDVRIDAVEALAPTHVIVNVEENRRECVDALRASVPHIVVTYPQRPQDNVGLYRLLGGLFGREDTAESLVERFTAAAESLRRVAAAKSRRDVLYLVWKKPWMAANPGTYIGETLRLAGWDVVPVAPPAFYPQLPEDPGAWPRADLAILPSEPYRFRARDRTELAARLAADTAVLRVDGELVSWYGSRAIAGMRYLRDLRLAEHVGRDETAGRRRYPSGI